MKLNSNDIIKVVCTFWSVPEYKVTYCNGKVRTFTEDTLPQKVKDFVIKRIGTEFHIDENVPVKIGYFVKRATYARL